MTETFEKPISYFKKMSTLKKVLIVFIALLIFIIVVEQPGSTSKKRESEKYFIPKLVIEDVTKVQIEKPGDNEEVILEKADGNWRIANGHSFPADYEKIDDFLKAMHSLKEGALVSQNPERAIIFSVDEKRGIHAQVWNHKERSIADFYAGETIPDGQYIKRTSEDEVYQTVPSLIRFLTESLDGWKDKILISVEESDVRRLALKSQEEELVIEKKENTWRVIQPEDYEADNLAIRTLFDQLITLRANSLAESTDASQVDFTDPDYKLSVRMDDDSLKLVLFEKSEEGDSYFAKSGEKDMVYTVDQLLIDSIFGLQFKPEDTVQ